MEKSSCYGDLGWNSTLREVLKFLGLVRAKIQLNNAAWNLTLEAYRSGK